MNYEIRAMSLGEILDMGFRLLRNHFGVLFGIGLVIYAPLFAAMFFLVGPKMVTPGKVPSELVVGSVASFALIAFFLSIVLWAAVTFAVGEIYLGRRVRIGAALRSGLAMLFPLLWTGFLVWLAIAGGFFAFTSFGSYLFGPVGTIVGIVLAIFFAVYVSLNVLLMAQVIVFEGLSGVQAIRRSSQLMEGNLSRGGGVLFVAGILSLVLSFAIGFALQLIPVVGPLGQAVAQAVSYAYISTVAVLLYFDIRSRKEAFDLEHLARLVESRSSAMPAHAG